MLPTGNPTLLVVLLAGTAIGLNPTLVRIHFIIVMIRWTGLAPWEFEFPLLVQLMLPTGNPTLLVVWLAGTVIGRNPKLYTLKVYEP